MVSGLDFYSLRATTASGKIVEMSAFKGQVILIVNTATKCGLAPQFEELEILYQKYKDRGLVILGFPSNQFANQEPESNESIESTCLINHGVTFTLFEKCDVNGPSTHPVFKFLKEAIPNFWGKKIKWNFTKFLVDSSGQPYKRYAPIVKPKTIENDILKLL